MINAEFFLCGGNVFTGFSISGHSGYSDSGSDIVCASVSSAVQLTANLITDSFRISADVSAVNNNVSLKITDHCELSESSMAHKLINALYCHLEIISEEYSENLKLTIRRCNIQ
jgi:uncharacterized protein YsxB (DUF464 family)